MIFEMKISGDIFLIKTQLLTPTLFKTARKSIDLGIYMLNEMFPLLEFLMTNGAGAACTFNQIKWFLL